MSRRVSAPQSGDAKPFPLRVHESVAFDLGVYCDALGAQWTGIINRAVREYIDRELEENPGFRARFEALRTKRLEEERRARNGVGKSEFRVIDSPTIASGKSRSGRRRGKTEPRTTGGVKPTKPQ